MRRLRVIDQKKQLQRVGIRIRNSVIEFCSNHDAFHADELRKHVTEECGDVAPGSADRILRDLRMKGVLDYKVVSRRESLYEILRAEQFTLNLG